MKKELIFLKLVLLLSVFLVGGFHIFVSSFLSFLLILFLGWKILKLSKINLNFNVVTFGVIVVAYLATTMWAIDSGTAIYGFVKFLPLLLFSLSVSFYSYEDRQNLLSFVPIVSVTTGVIAFGLSFIPQLKEWLLVSERLGGFFQSPNIFATYTLVGLVILITSEKLSVKKWLLITASIGLIFLSGSRSVFILLALVVLVMFVKLKNKKTKLAVASIFAFFVVLGLIIAYTTDSFQTVGRFLTISLNSSTFLGRLLYYKDAIPVILKNPFGLGYYGYYFSQGAFQTGVYSVAFVHNSVLQLLLDIGFVPAIMFCVMIAGSLFSNNINFKEKLVLIVILLHSFVDFDLQFISVFFVLILTLNFEFVNLKRIKVNKITVIVVSGFLIVISLYFAVVNFLFLNSDFKAVERIYGRDTISKMYLLQTEEGSEANDYADYIIENNGCLAIAYNYKAEKAFSNGDFEKVIEYKTKAIECARYDLYEYIDFLDKLSVGISLYIEADDSTSAKICIKEAKLVSKKLSVLKEVTSSLAWKIQDKPQLELPEEYKEWLKEISRMKF